MCPIRTIAHCSEMSRGRHDTACRKGMHVLSVNTHASQPQGFDQFGEPFVGLGCAVLHAAFDNDVADLV